ncbi:unnamed protein product [Mytilus edulis]|uniref:Uncharacterized protein n=1 Tax=Mytilus edulis TaxID=6550 RepID=A0A8S3QAS7_MYTED|nr:unnamed protein product [Mytilus edulis]
MIFLLILIIGTATGYDLKCPAKAEWRLKGNISCSSEDKYVCLFHLLEEKYMENCLGSDRSSIGSKLVFQPLFNLAECDTGRYQPIVFTTHGNSDCIYSKSKCADEGQLVFSNDSSSTDTACRCDYRQGYAFVTRPKNRCFCNPSDADCSCYKSTCTKLSAGCFVFAVIVLLKVGNYAAGEISTQIDGNETIDDVSIQSNENKRTVADDISTQINGNETTDNERQKFIHELFLKGECGKLHFARLVFIGKNGVGKTSLMRRLLWQEKEDVTSTQSTDGIEVEKCNINITNGKWTPCNETDDDLTRLIHQVYKVKNINVEGATKETVVDQQPVSSNADESSPNDGDTEINSESDPTVLEGICRADINASPSNNKDKHVVDENELNKIEPDNFELKNVKDSKLKSYPNENESDPVDDEKLKEMTSTIMTSCLQYKDEDQVDMAFCWLWDFAGQKDFYATHQVFLSKFAVYLLVTDSLEFSTAGNQGIDFQDSARKFLNYAKH